jgi:two-component system KDP operon response regulator KdpE
MTTVSIKVLVIDDEPPIRKLLRMGLSTQGYEIIEGTNGKNGLALLAENPDVIILDLGLPDIPGLDLLAMIRERNERVPIVVLSSRGDETAKVQALDHGADDYVTKPFGSAELRARVKAQLRRARMTPVPGGDAPLEIGGLTIDMARRTVTRDAATVHLTPTEWGLLMALVKNAGKTVTHQQLFRAVWGSAHGDAQQYLRVYVAHLRRKIEADPFAPRHVVTEAGVGYRFEPE